MEPTPSRIDIVRAMDELLLGIADRREDLFDRYQYIPQVRAKIDFPLMVIRDEKTNEMYQKLDILVIRLEKMNAEEYTPGICKPLPSDYKFLG